MTEHYLGIDVGYSKRGRTTGLCILKLDHSQLEWSCLNTGTPTSKRREDLRGLVRAGTTLAGVGIDGPLAEGLKEVNRYRIADALLARGAFQKRCKPGQTNSATGQCLHHHANELANLVIEFKEKDHLDLGTASHSDSIHKYRIVETFPNAFLAFLIDEENWPSRNPGRGKKSDEFWTIAVRDGYLCRLIQALAPKTRLSHPLDSIKDHDHRAAFICALAGMCVAKNKYTSVGDPTDGCIVLPPCSVWGSKAGSQSLWAETTLRRNMDTITNGRKRLLNHEQAKVICNGVCWF